MRYSTWVVAIGVSAYQDPVLSLHYAASNTQDLCDALSSSGGCAIPETHVSMLIDSEAYKKNILARLFETSEQCVEDDVLILFFSGHGEKNSDGFFLLPFDAVSTSLKTSAISSTEIRDTLINCRARGIFVMLDCCRGAGLAENADRLFTILGRSGFRLILSASRADQPSIEFESQKGTIFSRRLIELLAGHVSIGRQPGVIYFSELFDYLSRKLAEDLETLGHTPGTQDLVFSGSYALDPLLFILRDVALDTIEAEAPRYSRKFLYRSLRRWLSFTALVIVTILMSYYYYLEHSFYVWSEPSTVDDFVGTYLVIYAGNPQFNAFGFPHIVHRTDIPVNALREVDQPVLGTPPSVSLSSDIDKYLFSKLTPEWKSIVSSWQGDGTQAFAFLKAIPGPNWETDEFGVAKAFEGAAATTPRDQFLPYLVQSLDGTSSLVDSVNFASLARMDPDRAASLLATDWLGDPRDPDDPNAAVGYFEGVQGPCTPSKAATLESQAPYAFPIQGAEHSGTGSDRRLAPWLAAVLHTGCTLSTKTVNLVLNRGSFGATFYNPKLNLLAVLGESIKPETLKWLLADVKLRQRQLLALNSTDQSKYDASLRIWVDLRILAIKTPSAVPDSVFSLINPEVPGYVRLAAAESLLAKDRKSSKDILVASQGDPWVTCALAENGIYEQTSAQAAYLPLSNISSVKTHGKLRLYGNIVRCFLRQVRLREITAAIPLTHLLQSNFKEAEVNVEAARTLAVLEEKTTQAKMSVIGEAISLPDFSTESIEYADDLRRWAISVDRKTFNLALDRLDDEDTGAIDVLGRSQLAAADVREIRRRASNQKSKLGACAILAMRGSVDDLSKLLTSKDWDVRHTAMRYAIYNVNLPEMLKRKNLDEFGMQTRFYLMRQIEYKRKIEKTLASLPLSLSKISPSILARGIGEPTPGLMNWARDLEDSAPASTPNTELWIDYNY